MFNGPEFAFSIKLQVISSIIGFMIDFQGKINLNNKWTVLMKIKAPNQYVYLSSMNNDFKEHFPHEIAGKVSRILVCTCGG